MTDIIVSNPNGALENLPSYGTDLDKYIQKLEDIDLGDKYLSILHAQTQDSGTYMRKGVSIGDYIIPGTDFSAKTINVIFLRLRPLYEEKKGKTAIEVHANLPDNVIQKNRDYFSPATGNTFTRVHFWDTLIKVGDTYENVIIPLRSTRMKFSRTIGNILGSPVNGKLHPFWISEFTLGTGMKTNDNHQYHVPFIEDRKWVSKKTFDIATEAFEKLPKIEDVQLDGDIPM